MLVSDGLWRNFCVSLDEVHVFQKVFEEFPAHGTVYGVASLCLKQVCVFQTVSGIPAVFQSLSGVPAVFQIVTASSCVSDSM